MSTRTTRAALRPRPAAVLVAASLVLQVLVAAGGESAAVPGLGAPSVHPPWDAGGGWSPGTVTVLLVVAVLAGGTGVALGLRDAARGAVLPVRVAALAGALAVAALVLVPPLGSGDHLSYTAYGRIAAAGDDPYVEVPSQWREGQDPVAGAVQPPWQDARSVYGPVATALHAGASLAGGESLRLTVWVWQLVAGLAFGLTAWLLDRLVRPDPAARTRVAVIWTLNPLLLGQLVLGAHLDVVAVAAATGALLLCAPSPLLAGALVGVAAGIKAPYALFGLALCWGLRSLPPAQAWRRLGLGVLGAALVLVPIHLWSGPHTYDQLARAGRFVSWATPWRLLVDRLDPVFGVTPVRQVVGPVAVLLAVVLVVVLGRRLRTAAVSLPDPVRADAARAALVLALAWALAAPYALPWYDAMVWAPLALLAPTAGRAVLDGALLVRLTVLALAYVPGRVVGLSPLVEELTLGFRRYVAPWFLLAVLVVVLLPQLVPRARRLVRRPDRRQPSPPPAAPGRAHSPR